MQRLTGDLRSDRVRIDSNDFSDDVSAKTFHKHVAVVDSSVRKIASAFQPHD
ncbi:hypothetical protein RRSWK_05789 [Rhodopirellula sp. SWK7]|nr:hypothetical protein RRSWK_05789 [Rhodopirellula sp. SWK7]